MSNLDLIMEYASWSRLTSSSSNLTTQVVLPSSPFNGHSLLAHSP